MVWLFPAALLGLAAIAGPIVAHLLQQRHARRLTVPSVRFVAAADQSSIRLRRISDPTLLLVRAAIVVAAVLALAQPLLLTEDRRSRWAERVSRAVIVDTSESVRGRVTTEAIAAESVDADRVTTVEAREIRTGLKQAAAWLADAPPSRREIVVLSDFQRGAVTDADIATVPSRVGLRLVRVAAPAATDPMSLRVVSGTSVCSGQVELTVESTAVSCRSDIADWTGLQIVADLSDSKDVATLLRVVARAGVRAPAAEQSIVVRFSGAAAPRPAGKPAAGEWTFGAAQRLLHATRDVAVPVDVTSANGSLLVDVETRPGTLAAAQLTLAALNSRVDPSTLAEHEIATLPDSTLSGWSREPAPPDPADWNRTDDSDGRLLWALALLLLALESLLRGRAPEPMERTAAHAA